MIEASSGSAAFSEAYFARLLVSVRGGAPESDSTEKLARIKFYGGRIHAVEQAGEIYAEAHRLARETSRPFHGPVHLRGTCYGLAWQQQHRRSQLRADDRGTPPGAQVGMCGAGTGGARTIGRYVRYRRLDTRLCVVDPENSVFCGYHRTGDATLTSDRPSRIEGIGRPRVEPSFVASVSTG